MGNIDGENDGTSVDSAKLGLIEGNLVGFVDGSSAT